MIRLHDLTGAKRFPPYTFGYTSEPYYIGFLAVWGLGGAYREISFDEMSDDIFGDEIHWGSPVWHKWSSIYHFKCEGDIFPISRVASDAWLPVDTGRTINVLNPYDPTRPRLYIWDMKGSCRFIGDFGEYYRQNPHGEYARSRMLHSFVLYDMGRINSHGFDFLYRVTGPVSLEVFKGFDGMSYSYNPYYQVSSYVMSVSVSLMLVYENRRIGRPVYGHSTLDIHIPVGPSDADSMSGVAARLREEIQLKAGLDYNGYCDMWWNTTDLPDIRSQYNLSGLLLHRPNFEAIFDRQRRNPNWREMAAKAYQSLGDAEINGVAFLSEAISMGEEVRRFARTLKSIPSRKVKAAASAWLGVHYGFKLTLLDTVKLRDTLEAQALRDTRKSKCQSVSRYQAGIARYTARYQVFYNAFDHLQRLVDQLVYLSDATLTSENLWDMVPFSFVIDWFVQLGDVLQSLDNYRNLVVEHHVVAAGKSITGEALACNSMLGLPDSMVQQDIKLSCYFRRYSTNLEPPTLVPSVTVNPFNHMVEGAALFISRK